MSQQGQENQGTGLRDVFDVLVKAPQERLQSLTIQLSESPEDNFICALCLVVLQRKDQALKKFQMLTGNRFANHLAEKLQLGGVNLEDFGDHCGHFQELTRETLTVLARIFKVLCEQRLCEPLLRNLAYQRALSADVQNTINCKDVEYKQLIEEAKGVCGPQFAEWMCSLKDLKSGTFHDLSRSLSEDVSLSQDQSQRGSSLPSPLQASSSEPSYPTHLEISIPPTISLQGDKRIPETSDESKVNTPILLVGNCEATTAPGQSQSCQEPQSSLSETKKDLKMTFTAECRKLDSHISHTDIPNQSTKKSTELKCAQPSAASFQSKMADLMPESKSVEDDEEAKFYAFVILHAPEDVDLALSMKETLEAVVSMEGAIFSDDFAIPGRNTVRCVEDAINNSAFTILLLTRNFNTRMLEMKTNSALINSINTEHKYNTVIPLLPRQNSMPMKNLPIPLQALVPLQEHKNFEKKVLKAMTPAKLKSIKKIWTEDQRVKDQIKRRDKLKHLNDIQKQLTEEFTAVQLLERENLLMIQKMRLAHHEHGDNQVGRLQPANIHIQNANYIMIGNDSQMTVDSCGGADKEDSITKQNE